MGENSFQSKISSQLKTRYVIGVDGGGTKTIAALADLEGRVLTIAKSGSSNPRNVGIKRAAENIAKAIRGLLKNKKRKILSTFIGLAALEEEYKLKKEEIKKELLKQRGVSKKALGKITIGSDQIIAFRSATDKKEGVLLIAGTGCVAHGWRAGREAKASGWGWLNDEGSAFWLGQKALQSVLKDLDNRGPKTALTKTVFQKFKVKKVEDLLQLIYGSAGPSAESKNPIEVIPLFSVFCDEAAKRGDKIAQNIIKEAADELILSAKTVIKKLNFQKGKFPIVLIGGIFKSKIFLERVKSQIQKFAPKANFILPKSWPARGAVKLALENI